MEGGRTLKLKSGSETIYRKAGRWRHCVDVIWGVVLGREEIFRSVCLEMRNHWDLVQLLSVSLVFNLRHILSLQSASLCESCHVWLNNWRHCGLADEKAEMRYFTHNLTELPFSWVQLQVKLNNSSFCCTWPRAIMPSSECTKKHYFCFWEEGEKERRVTSAGDHDLSTQKQVMKGRYYFSDYCPKT